VAEHVRLLDTSVILRYLTGDSPEMQARAQRVIESEQTLGITAVVVLETAYTLTHHYGYERPAVVDALVELLTRRNVVGVGVDRDHMAAKLLLCRPSGTVSFGDALIAATAASAGLDTIYSFDEKMSRARLNSIMP
jgi:predicted nucleic acid-binding protein